MIDAPVSQRTFYAILGRMLAEHRKTAGWTLDKAASESGLDRGTVFRMERGTGIGLRNLLPLARALATEPSFLLRQSHAEAQAAWRAQTQPPRATSSPASSGDSATTVR
jgi:transcriptional regulator with XRE-family HTH domain